MKESKHTHTCFKLNQNLRKQGQSKIKSINLQTICKFVYVCVRESERQIDRQKERERDKEEEKECVYERKRYNMCV